MQYLFAKKAGNIRIPDFWVFCFLWAVLFILYLPASGSGLEGDFPYWVESTRNNNFLDYINTKSANEHSLYQFTQVVVLLIYKVFGVRAWLWHLLQVTLHAFTGFLLFLLCRCIFSDSGIRHPFAISLAGTFLFCVAPHASEVVVRQPCFHYMQGFIFILTILICTQRFMHTQKMKYAWYAGIIYSVSIFSLEIFYLTPWFVLALAAYYRAALHYDKTIFRRSLLLFFLPEVILFCIHLLLMHLLWGNRIAHVGFLRFDNPIGLFNKQIMYLFHILFLGRYFPWDLKRKIYSLCDSWSVVIAFYSILALAVLYILFYFRKMSVKIKAILLFAIMSGAAICLLIPLDFPSTLYVIGDRYSYVPSAFISMIFVLLVSFISYRPVAVITYSMYLFFNLYFTVQTNMYWYYSASVTKTLLTTLPAEANKHILLLNLPANMNGALMIRTHTPSEFKLMNNLFVEKNKVNDEVYDVCGYNMQQPGDGAYVVVYNDSMMHVIMNQWGTWWWSGDLGAYSYETDLYRVNMIDAGHWYELTLKHPASAYQLLYQVGTQWKTVDMSRKNVDQH